MGKKIQLQVPTPCHESWNNMAPNGEGRFCSSCKKKVIDFTLMGDYAIASFLKQNKGQNACGRFLNTQLNRDIELPKKKIPLVKYLFHLAIPALIASCNPKSHDKIKNQSKANEQVLSDENVSSENKYVTTGIISTPINRARSPIKRESRTRHPLSISANVDSKTISERQLHEIEIKEVHSQQPMYEELEGTMGGLEIRKTISYTISKPREFIKSILGYEKVNIYPNPVKPNSPLYIRMSAKNSGNQVLQLYNQSGQLILTKEQYNEGGTTLTLDIPSATGGYYFLKITDQTTKKSYTDKLLIL